MSQPAPSQTVHRNAAVEQQQPEAQSRPVQEPRPDDQQVVDDIQRELELQYQRQQQDVVSAAMQAMGALPPNAVFKVPAAALPLLARFSLCSFSDARWQRKQKTLDRDEAAVQEEWDAIPHETSARPSATSAAAGEASAAAVQPVATISYDDALAALAAADMSAAAPSVVLYEAPASCFGRLLHCFSRPSLHIQNAEEELLLPFLLALTPFDRYACLCVFLLLRSTLTLALQFQRHAHGHDRHVLL